MPAPRAFVTVPSQVPTKLDVEVVLVVCVGAALKDFRGVLAYDGEAG